MITTLNIGSSSLPRQRTRLEVSQIAPFHPFGPFRVDRYGGEHSPRADFLPRLKSESTESLPIAPTGWLHRLIRRCHTYRPQSVSGRHRSHKALPAQMRPSPTRDRGQRSLLLHPPCACCSSESLRGLRLPIAESLLQDLRAVSKALHAASSSD